MIDRLGSNELHGDEGSETISAVDFFFDQGTLATPLMAALSLMIRFTQTPATLAQVQTLLLRTKALKMAM
ncbi:hypothetical protein [Pacificibacter sp. AS14]|uniref:hypothetical protein n=1 Tax=Pacificibacter sp. AS14 TaxID=3135785 RepID=UPI00317DB3B9